MGSSYDSAYGLMQVRSPAHRCWRMRGNNEEGTVRPKHRSPGPSHQRSCSEWHFCSEASHGLQDKGPVLYLILPIRPLLTSVSGPGRCKTVLTFWPLCALKFSRPGALSVLGTQAGCHGFTCGCLRMSSQDGRHSPSNPAQCELTAAEEQVCSQ